MFACHRLFFLRVALGVSAVLFGAIGCEDDDDPDENPVDVRVDLNAQDGLLNERYIGFAFDTAQLTGGAWWGIGATERQIAVTPNLEDAKFRAVVSQVGPSILRVGGTDCDAFYFCPEPGECDVPATYQGTFRDPVRVETVMTQDDVARIGNFAQAVGAEVLSCLNVGPGPRDDFGVWDPSNAQAYIDFVNTLPESDVFTLWEPGNEVNVLPIQFDISPVDPVEFVDELETLDASLAARRNSYSIAAPGSFILPDLLTEDLFNNLLSGLGLGGLSEVLDEFGLDIEPSTVAGLREFPELTAPAVAEVDRRGDPDLLDIVSWHLYATQSDSCSGLDPVRANLDNLMDEGIIDGHRHRARDILNAAGGRPVWNTETASAQCGGQITVSDSMTDALWYMDWIGVMADEGTEATIRHSLVGADYSLLEPDFTPRPTFFGLVMMNRLVHEMRLATQVNRAAMKAHGYCSARTPGAVTVVLVNFQGTERDANVSLSGADVDSGEMWTLDTGGNPGSKDARINNVGASVDGVIPDLAGEPVTVENGVAQVTLSPYSVAFVELSPTTPGSLCN